MSAVPSAVALRPDAPPRVLLLDDDPAQRSPTARALRERGFEVAEFERAPPRSLMCIPDATRSTACSRRRRCPRSTASSLPARARIRGRCDAAGADVSALDDEAATELACEAGATDYCVRSSNWTLLAHRIRQAIRLRRLESGAAALAAAQAWTPRSCLGVGGADAATHPPAHHLRRAHGAAEPHLAARSARWPRAIGASNAEGLPGVAVDIDRFDHVGEALGRSASEHLLVEVARRRLAAGGAPLADGRGRIEAAANLRGPEFALLLDGLPDAAAALAIGREAVAALHEPFRVDARELFLRASVGVHAAGPSGDDASQQLARAELALRAAVASGGNCALAFDPSMAEPGLRPPRDGARHLHYALARGEMSMHYQPQVDVSDGRIVGFEALMRWEHGGRMQPAAKLFRSPRRRQQFPVPSASGRSASPARRSRHCTRAGCRSACCR